MKIKIPGEEPERPKKPGKKERTVKLPNLPSKRGAIQFSTLFVCVAAFVMFTLAKGGAWGPVLVPLDFAKGVIEGATGTPWWLTLAWTGALIATILIVRSIINRSK